MSDIPYFSLLAHTSRVMLRYLIVPKPLRSEILSMRREGKLQTETECRIREVANYYSLHIINSSRAL